ncbi:MAG: hypothetical protein WAU32_10000 [Thermoanaerobaculia bacterium]|jgi:hypothetical protein
MKTQQVFAIKFSRQPRVDESPGLVYLTIDGSNGVGPPRKVGALTDVALRGRLAHYDLHSANEVAAIRQALRPDHGHVTVHEGWSGLGSCLQFWHDFTGSQIRVVEWTCERCSALNRENVGSSVGETYSRACKCGKIRRITTAAHLPPMR